MQNRFHKDFKDLNWRMSFFRNLGRGNEASGSISVCMFKCWSLCVCLVKALTNIVEFLNINGAGLLFLFRKVVRLPSSGTCFYRLVVFSKRPTSILYRAPKMTKKSLPGNCTESNMKKIRYPADEFLPHLLAMENKFTISGKETFKIPTQIHQFFKRKIEFTHRHTKWCENGDSGGCKNCSNMRIGMFYNISVLLLKKE